MTDSSDSKSRSCLPNNKSDNKEEVGCPWHIDSMEHNNCLWTYIKAKSGPDGSMPELTQAEIAKLLGWSNTKTHFMLKQATSELVEALHTHKAKQLLNPDHQIILDVNVYEIEPVSDYPSEDSED